MAARVVLMNALTNTMKLRPLPQMHVFKTHDQMKQTPLVFLRWPTKKIGAYLNDQNEIDESFEALRG